MIWFTLALFALSFFLSKILAPKPSVENSRPGKFGDINFPRTNEGDPVPYVFGTVRLQAPNCVWSGDFRCKPIKEEINDEEVVTHYRYYVGFDLWLCLGPNVKLEKIWVENKVLSQPGIFGPTGVNVQRWNMFGGKKRGGGWAGVYRYYDGDIPQDVNTYCESKVQGGVYPGYPGIAHIVFERPYVGAQASLKKLSFEVSRFPNNLGLAAGVIQIGDDINPMEIIYDVMTDDWGGNDADPTDIDTTNFVTIAQKLALEGNGMSLAIQSAIGAQDVVEEVLRQIDGVLYQDSETGKIKCDLIRDDYVVSTLPILDETAVKEVKNWARNTWIETNNVVRITYTRRDRNYEDGGVIAQDMANINLQGRIKPITLSFPGVHKASLANTIGARELSQRGVPLFKCQIEVNRQAFALRPGSPFKFTWPDYNVANVIMRVQKYDLGELIQGRIVMDIVQDKFGVSETVFGDPEDSLWEDDQRNAEDVVDYVVQESPYWFVQRSHDIFPTADEAWFLVAARAADDNQISFDFVTNPNFLFPVPNTHELLDAAFNRSALLVEDLNTKMGQEDGLVAKIIVDTPLPDTDIFIETTTTQIRDNGRNLFVIGNELCSFETFTDNGDGTYDLENVRRALLDTKFADHSAGDPIHFLRGVLDYLCKVAHDDLGLYWYQFLSATDTDGQEIGDGTIDSVNFQQRYDRALPPDRNTVEGIRCPVEITEVSDIDVSWRERNRTDVQVVLVNDSTDTPEGGTTYNVRFLLDGVEQDENTGLTGTGPTNLSGLSGSGTGRIELEAVKGGLDSWTEDFCEFFFALYLSLSAELMLNGGFESGLTSWTIVSGSWGAVSPSYPVEPIGTQCVESTGTTNELSQIVDIISPTDYRGKAAIFRIYRGYENFSSPGVGQLVVELRDSGSVVLDSVITLLESGPRYGEWEKIEVPLPIRTDAADVRVRLIAPAGDSLWDGATLKVNTLSPTDAETYDNLGSSSITVRGAWGLRQLISTYSGSVVRIRDTRDNLEYDIGLDPDGNLEPFYVRGEARVVKLYDQSGNGAHLVQTNETRQPLLKWQLSETGRPSIWFDGTLTNLADGTGGTSRPYMVTKPSCVAAFGPKGDISNDFIFGIPYQDGLAIAPRWGVITGTTDWNFYQNGAAENDPWNGTSNSGKNIACVDMYTGGADTDADIYHNDDTTPVDTFTEDDITYPETTRLRIGLNAVGSGHWDGHFHELCIFDGGLAAVDRQTIMEEVALYWFNLSV